MKISDFLTEDTWMQGQDAVDHEGEWCSPYSRNACRWCLVGAMTKCYGSDAGVFHQVGERIHAFLGVQSIALWNDAKARTFAEVHALVVALDI